MTATTDPTVSTASPGARSKAPHVALVRPFNLAIDARGKKMALTLSRAGYRVTILAPSPDDEAHEQQLGPVEVRLVPIGNLLANVSQYHQKRRRRWRPRVVSFGTNVEYRAAAARRQLRLEAVASLASTPAVPATTAKAVETVLRAYRPVLKARRGAQLGIDRVMRAGWGGWNKVSGSVRVLVDELSAYPELGDWELAFRPVLEEIEPDVIHAHDPKVLGCAWHAVSTLRARGLDTRLVYDAREDFAGLPPKQQGRPRRHQALLNHERTYAHLADAVMTVSDPIADRLQVRLGLRRRPTVVLNVPVARERAEHPERDVRTDAGVAAGVPLLVYSGGVHRSRGVGLLVEALPMLPGVHLAVITVPFPHPMTPEMLERAEELGVADRISVLPPVSQGQLLDYLSTATVGVHPLEGGFPNHDSALPNKLFEYLHAGLPLVVSDAKEMAAFVARHGIGDVFTTDDALDLARAVKAVLGGVGDIPAERRAALVEEFSWQHQEPVVRSVYEIALEDRVPAAPEDLGDFPPLDAA